MNYSKNSKEGEIVSTQTKRYNPDCQTGLTHEQIEQRKKENLINYDTSVPTKKISQILRENFITLFNILNLILGILIFCVGSYKNMLFLLIVILNTAISTFQEIHSKRIVDKLSIMASSKVTAIRNGKKESISVNDIVLDDILVFQTGNQIPTDCILQEGEIDVNESFITGEPNTITKKQGEMLLSGSYLVSGEGIAKVEHIGEQNYTAQISSGAKYVKKVKSEIMTSLNKIIKVLTFAIVPIGLLLFWNQLHLVENTFQDAVVKTVAAMIGMIPEGLVLLTSTVLAVSVIRLSRSKVLVQELYCIETLARVDTLCLDKTGTLTEGNMEVKQLITKTGTLQELTTILANLANHSKDYNATMEAIRTEQYPLTEEWKPKQIISFSSETKWSGVVYEENGSYVMGAPEFVLRDDFKKVQKEIEDYSQDYRVLVIAHTPEDIQSKQLPNHMTIIGYVLLADKIRKNAKNTLRYFQEQGVTVKLISGDNPITVAKIGKQVGLENYDQYIDMTSIHTPEELEEAVNRYTIFGRVSPTQKKELILAMQKQGKTVAMTGDGVNDVLALKAADCSVAMANGSDAAKNVSQLVLLNSDFSAMPKVVAEGRRTINNIERSASLFLVKTIYSTINALLFLFIGEEYPFEPVQLSLISVVTIGIPSFILALEPNKERIKGDFLRNVISRAIPTALTVIVGIFGLTMLRKYDMINSEIYPSLCVIATGLSAICLLVTLAKARKSENSKLPFSPFRLVLAILMIGLFIFGLTELNWWFNICPLQPILPHISRVALVTIVNFIILSFVFRTGLKIERS